MFDFAPAPTPFEGYQNATPDISPVVDDIAWPEWPECVPSLPPPPPPLPIFVQSPSMDLRILDDIEMLDTMADIRQTLVRSVALEERQAELYAHLPNTKPDWTASPGRKITCRVPQCHLFGVETIPSKTQLLRHLRTPMHRVLDTELGANPPDDEPPVIYSIRFLAPSEADQKPTSSDDTEMGDDDECSEPSEKREPMSWQQTRIVYDSDEDLEMVDVDERPWRWKGMVDESDHY